ncbi:SWIM-type domain-containing protein [Citrus sinensis]|nr:SWIM-type domain-containing protein [Citrus sinensis]
MKNEALKITRENGLTTPESVQLSVTNPRNKLSIIVDYEAVLQAQFAAHDSMEVAVFEATILPTLPMLHNCGVQLSAEQITWVNDGGNEPPPRTRGIQGPPTDRIDDTDDDDADDDDQSEDNGADIMDDAKGSTDTSNSYYDLGTTQLKDYIEVHVYKPGRNGKHRLMLRDVYNEPRRFYKKCKISECPWYVMGGKIRGKGGFAIKELQKKHECRQTRKSVAVNSKWIAKKIKSKVAVDPHVKISVLCKFMLETYGVRIGDLKLYRARERARKDINGDHAMGYEDLFQYAAVIHKYDPGAICKVLCDVVTRLERVQKGLLGAIEITWPTAYHKPCARHIYANFCKEHPGVSLRNLFWRAISSTNKFDYAIAMEKLKKEKLEAWQWLETELAGFTWSRHEYDKNCKVDRTTNNTSRYFNNWILPHREKPCLTMLKEIRCMFMTLFTERKKEAQSWTNIPPRVKKELDATYECGSKMNIMASGDLHFQGYYPARRFIVDLMSRSCDCGYWDLAGIPYTHAMAAISHARHTVTEYLPKYISKEAQIPDKVTWDPCDRPKLFPHEITKKTGRPKKSRKRAATEPIKKNRSFYICCSFCGGMNHNVRKCPLRPSIARELRAPQGVSGPGESSNAARTSKRTKKVAVGGLQESFIAHRGRGGTGNRGRGGNRGRRGQGGNRARARGDGVRGRNRGMLLFQNNV